MTLMKMRSFCDGLGQEKYVVGQILNLVFSIISLARGRSKSFIL